MSECGCGEEEDGGFLVSVEKKRCGGGDGKYSQDRKEPAEGTSVEAKTKKNTLETSRNPQQCVIQMRMDRSQEVKRRF